MSPLPLVLSHGLLRFLTEYPYGCTEQLVGLPDPSMSRDHFALEAGVAAVVLRDLGSTNGTFVNEARVERHMLAEGDMVRAGATSLRVRLSLGGPA